MELAMAAEGTLFPLYLKTAGNGAVLDTDKIGPLVKGLQETRKHG
jgi:hypothetical protein